MSGRHGTYMVTFAGGHKVIFGNNYKWWYVHATEYVRHRFKDYSPDTIARHVMYSAEPFVDDGGLKWCSKDSYQEVIDDVAAKTGETLKPLSDYTWVNDGDALARLDKELKQ